jgi:2-oxoglutarate dehydrogenase E2 component (dihydrolipoamide succinyltransferase)
MPVIDLQTYNVIVISPDGKEIIYRNYVDISVAVATPTGLLVPVIRNVENLSFAGVEKVFVK